MSLSNTAFIEYGKRNKILRGMGFMSYEEYLKTPRWARIRRRIIRRDRGRCVLCRGKGWVVHHLRYTVPVLLGKRLDQLQTLCGACHEAIEWDYDNKRSPKEARKEFFRRRRMSRKSTGR